MAVWGAVMGGVNLLYQGAGWLEGGLTASYEKLILDAEILQMMSEVLQPLEVVDEASLGFDAIAEVGPGGHFFGTAHTLERYETAFYAPMLSDWRNFETWQGGGYSWTVDGTTWRIASPRRGWNGPDGPGFNQRFIGEISADGDRIDGRWERGLGDAGDRWGSTCRLRAHVVVSRTNAASGR